MWNTVKLPLEVFAKLAGALVSVWVGTSMFFFFFGVFAAVETK